MYTLFHFKDSLEKKIHSGIIYCYQCCNCNVTYYGKNLSLLYQSGWISSLTGKCPKNVRQSAISDHLLQCNCTINFGDFDILAAESNKFRESFDKMCQNNLKQDDKSLSIRAVSLRWQFYFYYSIITWLSEFY